LINNNIITELATSESFHPRTANKSDSYNTSTTFYVIWE